MGEGEGDWKTVMFCTARFLAVAACAGRRLCRRRCEMCGRGRGGKEGGQHEGGREGTGVTEGRRHGLVPSKRA